MYFDINKIYIGKIAYFDFNDINLDSKSQYYSAFLKEYNSVSKDYDYILINNSGNYKKNTIFKLINNVDLDEGFNYIEDLKPITKEIPFDNIKLKINKFDIIKYLYMINKKENHKFILSKTIIKK